MARLSREYLAQAHLAVEVQKGEGSIDLKVGGAACAIRSTCTVGGDGSR